MIFPSAFTVFALGLRHGADPDHLAAIDAMTRSAAVRSPRWSRFVGALFAGGHTVMVIAIAALVGLLGSRFAAHGDTIERIGTCISIGVLLLLAALNVRQLARGETDRVAGARLRLIPKALRESGNPALAAVVGLLFGFGFETSSQVAAYATAFGAHAGVLGSVLVGAMFCAGMIVTDTLDSLLVHRLVAYRNGRLPAVTRVWIATVTLCALGVAGYEIAQIAGIAPQGSEIAVSAVLVAALLLVFLYVYHSTRPANADKPRHSIGATTVMNILRSVGVIASVFALTFAISLYSFQAARGSDHQDSPTTVKNPLADVTDVFAFPDPKKASNVVLVMDVDPLIPAGMTGGHALDPNVLYQFKIATGLSQGDYREHVVIQLRADKAGTDQHVTLYGPHAPNEIGTANTLVASTGTFAFDKPSKLGAITAFVGPRRDPFFFDLAQFFKIVPDRNYANHPNPPAPTATSFNFPTKHTKILDVTGASYGTAGQLGCIIAKPNDILYDFNTLSIVVELPKAMLAPAGGKPGVIGLWATTATPDGKSE